MYANVQFHRQTGWNDAQCVCHVQTILDGIYALTFLDLKRSSNIIDFHIVRSMLMSNFCYADEWKWLKKNVSSLPYWHHSAHFIWLNVIKAIKTLPFRNQYIVIFFSSIFIMFSVCMRFIIIHSWMKKKRNKWV